MNSRRVNVAALLCVAVIGRTLNAQQPEAGAAELLAEAKPANTDPIEYRLVRDDIDQEFVFWVAMNARPELIAADQFPAAEYLTAAQVAERRCGMVPEAYWKAFEARNDLPSGAFDRSRVLGGQAFKLKWPACFFVERGDFRHVVVKGELASDVYLRETGSPGTAKTHAHFFRKSGIADVSKLAVGDVLRYGFRTRPVFFIPEGDRELFAANLTRLAAAQHLGRAESARLLRDPAGTFSAVGFKSLTWSEPLARNTVIEPMSGDIDDGQIVTAGPVQGEVATFVNPPECGTEEGIPFDVVRTAYAYDLARRLGAPFETVKVIVADNGFFGADRVEGRITFREPAFKATFFSVSIDPNTRDQRLGPRVELSGKMVDPLNTENGFGPETPPGAVSGHGTHVAGLVLGGPVRNDNRFFGGDQEQWMKVRIIPFAPGTRTIPVQSSVSFDAVMLAMQNERPDIVNMSLSYGPKGGKRLERLFRANSQTLFVVAAGNSGVNYDVSEDVPIGYPAQLSPVVTNLIAVTAEDGKGNLTWFGNRSSTMIDIAAPGCNILSTVDGRTSITLSGTSQAAPLVTFAAALLRRVNVPPERIRHRLAISGDLLSGQYVKQNEQMALIPVEPESKVPVRSRSRINIAKALYKDFDYLRFVRNRMVDGVEQSETIEVLGVMNGRPAGPQCGNLHLRDVVAFKRVGTGRQAWCFGPLSIDPQRFSAAGGGRLNFDVRFRLNADGKPEPDAAIGPLRDLPLNRVEEFILSDTSVDQRI